MFGKRLTELGPIKEAVATYMMRASGKLRTQGSVCKKIRVSIRTGMFNPDEAQYANGALVQLPYPTNDVRVMTQLRIPRHLDTQPTIIWTLIPSSLGHLPHVHLDRQSERSDAGLHC
ncbi:hypothetical protein BV326_05887 [Pseudomonas syringae pv. actinidiae]|uniref:DinB/UmuC family translesion DNA polymerase n=1 Tax=Pseudomonas syringae TaxID=317 RepID=UPI000A25FC73|nr:hypothetical protein [Pseudomonas syringae]OSR62466.1 hypothetical protein BV326_05887 [Pseudomonas syringae pv. actinidiae]